MLFYRISTYFAFQSTLAMSEKDYLKDISEIKNIMDKSSRFISLSGLSSIYTGVFGLIGGAYYFVKEIKTDSFSPYVAISIFIIVSLLSVLTTIYFTHKRAKKINEKAWINTAEQLVSTFSITLIIGTCYIIILAFQENFTELIPLVPLIYGLSLIHAAKHTKNIVKPLGYIQILIAFLCVLFIEQSFWLYIIGFGGAHLINGLIIYFKYDK